jgi:GntR family transcriptional regulator
MPLSLALDPRDPLPLYAQLERGIKAAIAAGTLDVGAQLPTVRQLAVELKINANTVAKVYAELERQEVLTTRRGVGTFVAQAPVSNASSQPKRGNVLRAFAERFLAEAAAQGFTSQEVHEEIRRLCQPL